MTNVQPVSIEELLHRIRGEYLEMPGLNLTLLQATRLWGLDGPTCLTLLKELTNARFLARTADGSFVRAAS